MSPAAFSYVVLTTQHHCVSHFEHSGALHPRLASGNSRAVSCWHRQRGSLVRSGRGQPGRTGLLGASV
jgi:hypothetical protein